MSSTPGTRTEPPAAQPAGSLLGRLETLSAVLSKAALWLAGASCLTTLGVICYTVVMRYVFSRPPTWNEEVAGWLVVVSVMLAIPEAQRRGEHIGVDLLVEKFPGARRILLPLGCIAVAVAAGILIHAGLEMVVFSRTIGIVSNTLPAVQLWTVQILVPVGGGLLLLVALTQLAVYLAGGRPRDLDSEIDHLRSATE